MFRATSRSLLVWYRSGQLSGDLVGEEYHGQPARSTDPGAFSVLETAVSAGEPLVAADQDEEGTDDDCHRRTGLNQRGEDRINRRFHDSSRRVVLTWPRASVDSHSRSSGNHGRSPSPRG